MAEAIMTFVHQFHFLRPLWLLLFLLVPLVPVVWRRISRDKSGWESVMPSPLLRPLLSGSRQAVKAMHPAWPITVLVVASLALAGPSWRRAPTPLHQETDSLVVVMDMSLSMLATDINPDRLTRVKQKLRDLLSLRQSAFTGLVVYAGDAHTVTPITDDTRTIATLLPALDPLIMPATGNRADLGIKKAIQLIKQGAPGPAHILLMTDDVSDQVAKRIRAALKDTGYRLDILVVGTRAGGPIPVPDHGFIRDNGKIVMAKARPAVLEKLAAATGGRAVPMTLNDSDLRSLDVSGAQGDSFKDSKGQLKINRWQDDGYWLVWLLLPLALWCWRRGALLVVPLLLLMPFSAPPAQASTWSNLWQRPDQQGYANIAKDPAKAATEFRNPMWKGSALYRAGQYAAAAKAFADVKTPDADYNRGNALAKAGKLQDAIQAYDDALKMAPDMPDAKANRALVEKLLKKQKQQQKNSQNQNQNQNQKKSGSKSSSDKNGSGQSSSSDKSGKSSKQDNSSQDKDKNDNSGKGSKDEQNSKDQSGQGKNDQSQKSSDSKPDQKSSAKDQSSKKSGQDQADNDLGRKKDNAGKATPRTPKVGNAQPNEAKQDKASGGQEKSPLDDLTQSDQQWLRQVPDDPSGLLRRKFLYQYRQQHQNDDSQQLDDDTPW